MSTTKLLARIDLRRRSLLAEVDQLDAEQMLFRPAPGSWSVLDVVEHLVKVEEGILSRVRPRAPRTWRETVRAWAGLQAMSLLFLTRRRIRVPVEAVRPQGGATLSDLVTRWDASQAGFRRTMEGFGPGELARPMMRHPLIGLLTPGETLTFIARHIGHHHRQIGRIRRMPGFPRY